MIGRKGLPDRGEIWEVDFEPQTGAEQMKRRPALILSPQKFNKMGIAFLCPITERGKKNDFEVQLPTDLDVRGVVMSQQIKSFDWRARKGKYLCDADVYTLEQVVSIIETILNDD